MKFGINTLLWGATFDFHRLPAIKAAGFDGIEVAILDPVNFPAAAIRRELEMAALECTAVAIIPRGLGLGVPDATIRSRARTHVSAWQRLARICSPAPCTDRCLTIESFGFALGELSAAAAIWRDLAATPDDIAIEGVKFLRRQCRVRHER
jgi:sugar phosphate isomerase/epimerase